MRSEPSLKRSTTRLIRTMETSAEIRRATDAVWRLGDCHQKAPCAGPAATVHRRDRTRLPRARPPAPHAGAQVHTVWLHRRNRLGHVVKAQPAGQPQRQRVNCFAEAADQGPVVRAAGAPELFHRLRRVARIQQHRVDPRRNSQRVGH